MRRGLHLHRQQALLNGLNDARRRGVKNMLKAKAIFFLSNAYKEQVFGKYVPKKYKEELLQKSYVIPNGIDDFWFDNQNKESNKIIDRTVNLAYAGRIDKNKNIVAKYIGCLTTLYKPVSITF